MREEGDDRVDLMTMFLSHYSSVEYQHRPELRSWDMLSDEEQHPHDSQGCAAQLIRHKPDVNELKT